MSSQQTPYTTPPIENRPPVAQLQAGPEYNEQFIETLAQRLMPRLMPEIMYHLRTVEPGTGDCLACAADPTDGHCAWRSDDAGRGNDGSIDWDRGDRPGHSADQCPVQLYAV